MATVPKLLARGHAAGVVSPARTGKAGDPGGVAYKLAPGLGLAVGVACVATLLGHWEPIVGAPVFGIVIGLALAPLVGRHAAMSPGVSFAGKRVLQAAIVVLGTGLSLAQVVSTGVGSLPVMLGTLALALVGAWVLGRALHIRGDLATLVGVGTGICGASAIAATTAVIEAAEVDVAYAISTIFTFNVIAVLAYPQLGHLMGLSQHGFGLWAGTAINDVSSVVAAAYTYGHAAGSYAVVVKLTRTLMIIPICIALAGWRVRRSAAGAGMAARVPWRRLFPWFIAWFVVAVAVNTLGLIPSGWHHDLSTVSVFLITVALAAIGLSARFADMRRIGPRPLVLGACLWATVGAGSLLLQFVAGYA